MFLRPPRLIGLYLLATLLFAVTGCSGPPKTGKHLFILSGQSNMTGGLKNAFEQRIQERYGEDNAAVVMTMKSGRGIRFWVVDYTPPAKRAFSERASASNGQEYTPLIEAARLALAEDAFETVGFIWMQGESDANNRLSEVYEQNFLKLVEQLKTDLERDDLYFVIGRITDYARNRPDNEHWRAVRETQVALGSTPGNGWIDTDDLNKDEDGTKADYIHFPKEGAAAVGRRFADKAIQLIDQR